MTMSKQQYHSFVMDLAAIKLYKDETTYSVPCPACGQSKSFSLTNNGMGFLYHCFRNSCGVYGFIPMDHTVHDKNSTHGGIVARRKEKQEHQYPQVDLYEIDTHDYPSGEWKEVAEDSGINDATILTKYGLKYDERSDRIYIPLTNGFLLRRSNYKQEPKSLTYRTGPGLNVFYASDHAENTAPMFLVEDCYSAIKIAEAGHPAIALLGTSLPSEFKLYMRADGFVVWLDADAIQKAVKIANYISSVAKSQVVYTDKDPKHYSVDEIKSIIKEQCGT